MNECVVRMKFYKNCLDCDLHQIVYGDSYADTDVYCFKEKRFVGKRFGPTKDLARPDWCPIICSLPEGHGGLIDLETAAEGLSERYNSCHMTCGAVMQFLDGLPAIVPAERSEKDGR